MFGTKELPRIDTSKITAQLALQREEMLETARKTIGYRSPQPNTLLQKLIALEIAPFRTLAVEQYKKSKEKVGIYSGTRDWLIWLLSSVSVLGGGIYGANHLDGGFKFGLCVLGIIIGAASSIISLAFGIPEMKGTGIRTVSRWDRVALSHYDGAIPDHVLQKAIEIKKAIPNAYFEIDYLESTREIVERDPDPFLRVCDSSHWYYVEQWDEKDFERIEE